MEWLNSWWADVYEQIYATFVEGDRWQYLVKGIGNTIQIAFFAVLLGIVIGVIVALIKVFTAGNKKFRWLEIIANIYLTVIRGTPMLVQLFIMYYIVITSPNVSKIFVSILAFGINSGAYVAEVARSGIQSIDKGQMEAGRSLGLNRAQTMVKIIFPQALKNILPALGNEFIT